MLAFSSKHRCAQAKPCLCFSCIVLQRTVHHRDAELDACVLQIPIYFCLSAWPRWESGFSKRFPIPPFFFKRPSISFELCGRKAFPFWLKNKYNSFGPSYWLYLVVERNTGTFSPVQYKQPCNMSSPCLCVCVCASREQEIQRDCFPQSCFSPAKNCNAKLLITGGRSGRE